jgi:hypothetical protein
MPGLLLAAMLAAAAQPPVPAPHPNVVFARGHLDGWSMRATSMIDDRPSGPVIDRMLCEIERNGVQVMTWRHGDAAFSFGGTIARGGREHRLGHESLRALVVDGVAYEVERRHRGALTDRYMDVPYPESQTVYPPSEFFSLAVRRQGSDLWLHAANIDNELIEARRLRVGFRDAEAGPMLWIEVPMTGLAGALGWCHAAMSSPDALRLHPS